MHIKSTYIQKNQHTVNNPSKLRHFKFLFDKLLLIDLNNYAYSLTLEYEFLLRHKGPVTLVTATYGRVNHYAAELIRTIFHSFPAPIDEKSVFKNIRLQNVIIKLTKYLPQNILEIWVEINLLQNAYMAELTIMLPNWLGLFFIHFQLQLTKNLY